MKQPLKRKSEGSYGSARPVHRVEGNLFFNLSGLLALRDTRAINDIHSLDFRDAESQRVVAKMALDQSGRVGVYRTRRTIKRTGKEGL